MRGRRRGKRRGYVRTARSAFGPKANIQSPLFRVSHQECPVLEDGEVLLEEDVEHGLGVYVEAQGGGLTRAREEQRAPIKS